MLSRVRPSVSSLSRQCGVLIRGTLTCSTRIQTSSINFTGMRTSRMNTNTTKRFFSNGSKAGENAGSGEKAAEPESLWKKALSLYCILFGANYISNMMIHPTQKIDYGIMNKLFLDGREVNAPFWGSRLPHLFLIPTFLTGFDLAVTPLFARYFGLVSFAATPAAWLLNLYVYTFLAVGSYISVDAMFNPAHEGRRADQVLSNVKTTTVAMGLQWHSQMMLDVFGSTATGPIAMLRNAFAVALVFLPVKSLGFGDFMESGLSAHERKMNNLPPLETAAAPIATVDAATSTSTESEDKKQ